MQEAVTVYMSKLINVLSLPIFDLKGSAAVSYLTKLQTNTFYFGEVDDW